MDILHEPITPASLVVLWNEYRKYNLHLKVYRVTHEGDKIEIDHLPDFEGFMDFINMKIEKNGDSC